MTTARIICDASYNEDIHLGGFSGGVMVSQPKGEDWTSIYHGLSPDSFCSNEAEMHAIAMGAQKLASYMSNNQQTLDKVEIFTDSKTAMEQYSLYTNGKLHDPKYDKAMKRMDLHLSRIKTTKGISFTHVPAHRPDSVATPIERLHNIIDKNALSTRWMAQNHIFKPEIADSKYYGITLNAQPRGEKAQKLRQIGYHYAKEGMVARVSILGKDPDMNTHPFAEGVRQAAAETGQDPDKLMTWYRWSRKGGLAEGCEGMDRTLVRHHYRQMGKFSHHVNFDLMPFLNAGVAVRLMYGPQYPKDMNDKFLTGRVEPASKFILNTFSLPKNNRPAYTNEWVDTLSTYTTIPLIQGVDAALKHAQVPQEHKIKDPDQPVREALRGIIPEDPTMLPANAIKSLVRQVMVDYNRPLGDESLDKIEMMITNQDSWGEHLVNEIVHHSYLSQRDDDTRQSQAPRAQEQLSNHNKEVMSRPRV